MLTTESNSCVTLRGRSGHNSLLLVLMVIALGSLGACGGGGSASKTKTTPTDPGQTTTEIPPNVPPSAAQEAFARTVYPIVEKHCVACHSDSATAAVAKFAHSDLATAYSVTMTKALANLTSPPLSAFVQRLVVNQHFCWSDCTADGSAMAKAITDWNTLLNTVNEPAPTEPGTGTTPISSVSAFAQTVQPIVTQYCASCHAGNLQGLAAFANADAAVAHDALISQSFVDLTNPAQSRMVARLAVDQHYCWSDCATDAARMEGAIAQWQQLITATPGNGNNRPPLAVNDSFAGQLNTELATGNVLLNDSDPDGDTLAITANSATSQAGGTVVNNLNGTFSYTPPANFSGSDTFQYTIADDKGASASATVTIAVSSDGTPTVGPDLIRTNLNTAVTTSNLLTNDKDPNGDALTITSVTSPSLQGGTVRLNADGSVTFIPAQDYTGRDEFNYSITDTTGKTATGFVQVSVNSQPVAIADSEYTYTNTRLTRIAPLSNDVDTDGDALTISSFDSASAQAGTVTANGDGTFSYLPPVNFQGTDSFAYIVADGRGSTANGTVFINVVQPALRDDNRFLQFLDQTSPLFQENADSARAYYRAIDPLDQKTNLQAWRTANGFNIGADAEATYINANDLGFARRMFIRTDPTTGIVASYVENYANLANAIARTNVIATVAMEYTVAPGKDPLDPTNPRYTTFYVFGANGQRDLGADLDGRGFKFNPGLCNTCHGGRPKAIVNGVYPDNGDTQAGFLPWDLDTFLFSDATATVSRSGQEAQFKIFNQTVLKTNPLAAQKEIIEGWYGGPTLPANTFNGQFVPSGWQSPKAPANATQLYLQVVAPYCRTCHLVRGPKLQSDLDLASYEKFMSYKNRIDALVFDEGVMPLAKLTFERFWANPVAARTLATFLGSKHLLENDQILTPGRPLGYAGPFRHAGVGTVLLNGNASRFDGGATPFTWTLISRPARSVAALATADQALSTFVADVPGDYRVRLVVNDGVANTPASPPTETVIRVKPNLRGTSFVSDIAPLFDDCKLCHTGFDKPKFTNPTTLYDNVVNFVNKDDPVNSPLLVKPSGKHHGGGTISGFETPVSPKYELLLRWIVEGAQDN